MIAFLYRVGYKFVVAALIVVVIASCSSNSDNISITSQGTGENCRVVQHVMGQSCIPVDPHRVVTMWMGTFRSVLALGIKPVASTWVPDEQFPAHLGGEMADVEYIGTLTQPNLEKILLLKPDLILSNTRLEDIYQALSTIAPTVVLKLTAPPPAWKIHLKDVAKVLDKEKEEKQLVNDYWRRIEDLKHALGDNRPQMQVSVATVDQHFGIYVYGQQHPTSKVLSDLGLNRPPMQTGDFFVSKSISQERILDIDGDILFLSYRGGNPGRNTLTKLQQNPLWNNLRAVRSNQVYFVDSAHWYGFDVLAMYEVLNDLYQYLAKSKPNS